MVGAVPFSFFFFKLHFFVRIIILSSCCNSVLMVSWGRRDFSVAPGWMSSCPVECHCQNEEGGSSASFLSSVVAPDFRIQNFFFFAKLCLSFWDCT